MFNLFNQLASLCKLTKCSSNGESNLITILLYFLFRPTPPNAYGEPAPNSQSQFAPSRAPEGAGMPPGNMPPMVGDLMNNPMYGMASTVGQQIMGQYGEETKKNLEKYVSIGQLKYYFAVDTSYVAKKLGVLLFPFTRTDWAVKYNQVKQPLFFPKISSSQMLLLFDLR